MELFDDFDDDMNHAVEYKRIYLDGDISKLSLLLLHWLAYGNKDGFFKLAMILLLATTRTESLSEVLELYKSSFFEEFDDTELYEWYNDTILELMDSWAKDEIMSNPELKKKFDEYQSRESKS